MPSYLVKQPDGKYAMFSTIVDDFTHADMTEDQAVLAVFESMGEDDRENLVHADMIDRAKRDAPAWEYDHKAPHGQRRWMGAIAAIQRVHGEARAQRRVLLDFIEDE